MSRKKRWPSLRTSRLIMLPLVSLVGLLSGCATFPTSVPSGPASTTPSNSAKARVAVKEQAAPIEIRTITQTDSQMSFTFNQPIKDVHILSQDTSLFLSKTDNSVTFKRSPSANVSISVLVTATGGGEKLMTLRIPEASASGTSPTKPSTSSSTSPSSSPGTQERTPSSQAQSSSSAAGGGATSDKGTSAVSSSPSKQSPPSNSAKSSTMKVHPGEAAPLIYFGPATGRHVYITVDDGWVPSERVLKLMQQQHVPITAFLIQNAAEKNLSYWKQFVAAGGIIQDHTINHPWLGKLTYQQDLTQWQGPVKTYPQWFKQTPTLGRPPYGSTDQNVLVAAHDAGLHAVVMWSAEFNPNKPSAGLQTWNGKPLSPGEIVLLHWQPGLYNQIEQVLAICKQQHLVPAPLVLHSSQMASSGSATNGSKGK